MLDKLDLNKIYTFISFLLLAFCSGCYWGKEVYNTEVSCQKIKVLVRFAELEEVKAGIERALADKIKYGTNENYTVIRMPGNRSFRIEKLPPEDAVKCSLTQIKTPLNYRKVEKYYH